MIFFGPELLSIIYPYIKFQVGVLTRRGAAGAKAGVTRGGSDISRSTPGASGGAPTSTSMLFYTPIRMTTSTSNPPPCHNCTSTPSPT